MRRAVWFGVFVAGGLRYGREGVRRRQRAESAARTLSAELRESKGKSFKGKSDAAVACCEMLAHVSGESPAGAEWAMTVLSVCCTPRQAQRRLAIQSMLPPPAVI